MKVLDLKFVFAFLVAAGAAGNASASYLTCSATVNGAPSAVVDQFPASLDYELTVNDAWCDWCATQDAGHWCHLGCSQGQSSSVVMNETDAPLAAFVGAPIAWVSTNPSWAETFPFLLGGGSVTTPVSFTVASYADCATRARGLPVPALPDANGVVTFTDEYKVFWNLDGVPPYYAACQAELKCLPPQGQTRTLGYFKTHPAAVDACLSHGAIDLGFMNVSSSATALGLLYASPAKYADGTKRSAYDQARVLLARQLLVAICNGRVFGSSPADASLIGDAVAALVGTSCGNMNWLQGQLDAFNNSGDTGENFYGSAAPGSYADPTVKTAGACQ